MHGVTLVLIDDNAIDRYITRRLFSKIEQALDVVEFDGAQAALEYLAENEVPAGRALLIMVDLNMPVMTGHEFLEAFARLRQRRRDLERSVVNVLTSSSHPDDLHRSKSCDFLNRHYVKMPGNDELRALVDSARSCATD